MTATAPAISLSLFDTLAESPQTQLLAGGTDFMVEVNFGRRDPLDVVALRRVRELRGWVAPDDVVTLRAGLTYTEMQEAPLAALVPAARAGGAHRRLAADPQCRHARWQPRHRLAGGRRAAGARRARRAVVLAGRVGNPPHPARGVHHRAEAERVPARRSDPRRRAPPARARKSS